MTINGRREGVFGFTIYCYVVFLLFIICHGEMSARSCRYDECYIAEVPKYSITIIHVTARAQFLIIYGKKYKNHNLKIMSNLHIFLSHQNSQ